MQGRKRIQPVESLEQLIERLETEAAALTERGYTPVDGMVDVPRLIKACAGFGRASSGLGFEATVEIVRAVAEFLDTCAYDEIAVELETLVDGDEPEALQDAYGRPFIP